MKHITRLFLLFIAFSAYSEALAQASINSGLIRSHLTISPSYQFQSTQSHFSFHGGNDIYLNRRFSIATDGYFYLGSLNAGLSEFDYNHLVLWGGNFHFVKSINDLYFGFQPGVSFTKIDAERNYLATSSMGVNTVFSTTVGYNCYISNMFHFFLQSKLVLANHSFDKAQSINELKISAGLGFNFN